MKTTVELDDHLLREAKKRAIDEGITLRALLEGALRDRLEKSPSDISSLVGWGGPGKSDREALYDETYGQIIADIEAAMCRYDERHGER